RPVVDTGIDPLFPGTQRRGRDAYQDLMWTGLGDGDLVEVDLARRSDDRSRVRIAAERWCWMCRQRVAGHGGHEALASARSRAESEAGTACRRLTRRAVTPPGSGWLQMLRPKATPATPADSASVTWRTRASTSATRSPPRMTTGTVAPSTTRRML